MSRKISFLSLFLLLNLLSFHGIVKAQTTSEQLSADQKSKCGSLVAKGNASAVLTETVQLTTCSGSSVEFEGMSLPADTIVELKRVTSGGCDSVVRVEVKAYPPLEFSLTSEYPVCNKETNGKIVATVKGGQKPYWYSLDNDQYQLSPRFGNLGAGLYTVYVRDNNGCIYSQQVEVARIAPLNVRVDDAILHCSIDSLTLLIDIASDHTNVQYTWQDGSDQPHFTVYRPGIYWVDVSNECETVFQEILVAEGQRKAESPIYVPNAFSPNGDGYNDFYRCYPASGVTVLNYELQVFDQNGNKVFETFDIADEWDGFLVTKEMEASVFACLIRAKVLSCGEEMDFIQRGSVRMLKER